MKSFLFIFVKNLTSFFSSLKCFILKIPGVYIGWDSGFKLVYNQLFLKGNLTQKQMALGSGVAGSQVFQWLSPYSLSGVPVMSLRHPKPPRSAFGELWTYVGICNS